MKDVCISCLGLYLPKEVLPHMHKWGRVMINLNCLHYLVTSSNQNMEGESLGDYITCGTCDVMSGRHMKGWCLTKSFKALSLSNVCRAVSILLVV